MAGWYFFGGPANAVGGFTPMGGDLFSTELFGWEAVLTAGDTISVPILGGDTVESVAQPTYKVASTDTAQALAAAKIYDTTYDRRAVGALLEARANEIRIAFDADPTQGANGLGHDIPAGSTFVVSGYKNLENLRFISAANTVSGDLNVTVYF